MANAYSHQTTEAVAAFIAGTRSPQPGHETALSRAILDTVGSALAGMGTAPDRILRQWITSEGSTGRSTVWTSGQRVSAATAALCNGTSGHALDWDDVSPGSAMHPSTVLLPALLAVSEERGTSGSDLVRAHDVGAAVFRGLTQALPRAVHYGRGWHTTATVGRLAAVAAVAALVGLDERACGHALGLAGSLAAGSLANFGSMTKPLHAGLAARDAVMAVALAESGFTAGSRILEATGGFFDLYGDKDAARLATLAEDLVAWRSRWACDWAQKFYPACYATHRAIDAVLRIRRELGGRSPQAIRVVTEPGGLRPLIDRRPANGTEAKFNLAYVLGVALVYGKVTLAHFDDTALQDDAVARVAAVVSAREQDSPPVGEADYRDGFTVVEIDAGDGHTHRVRVDTTYGDAASPLSDADLAEKAAEGCRIAGFSAAQADGITTALQQIPHATVPGDLLDVLARPHRPQEATV
ncbi:MmgE/PrpD family protein [Prauserella oleivorans]|uniref:MmgE/PrpD family protein n=1 Tax=Prauserella oleivorans TaxID=1478153 RepID=A0ABW5WBM5_9PSEU